MNVFTRLTTLLTTAVGIMLIGCDSNIDSEPTCPTKNTTEQSTHLIVSERCTQKCRFIFQYS